MTGYGDTESTLPAAEQSFGSDRLSSAEIAAAALAQMGEPPMPGYGDHRRRQYQDLPPIGDLREQMGI
jgi:hypothetical protein